MMKILSLSPYEMKEEIETKHFEHTFAVQSHSSPKQVEVCAFHHNPVSHGLYRVMSVTFLFSFEGQMG